MGDTKRQCLKTILQDPIAGLPCEDITSHELYSLAERLQTGKKTVNGKLVPTTRVPATVGNYMSHLGPIFVVANTAWKMPLDRAQYLGGLGVAWQLGVAGKSTAREVRPTMEQLDILMGHFIRKAYDSVPMHKLLPFAIASCRRQAEIVNLQWKDLNVEEKTILVREMKHPQKNNPNKNIKIDVECKLTDEALKIILSMPRVSEFIFPFSKSTVCTAFTEACAILGIEDLHFHDMRHEAISRLFEMNMTIPKVKTYSGHRSWAGLERYAQIRHKGDVYEGWEWWDTAFAAMDEAKVQAILARREVARAAAAKRRPRRGALAEAA